AVERVGDLLVVDLADDVERAVGHPAVVLSSRVLGMGAGFGIPRGPCYPSTRTQAGCPSGQWEWTVNPSRKLRRFESFTCHPVHEGPPASGNADRRPFGIQLGHLTSHDPPESAEC